MSRAATSRLKVNPPIGSLPVLQYCSPEQLRIDPEYQRTIETGPSQTLIRRIAMFWDWGLCQPLVVARRADGGLYVVDGQHRLAAAKLRGDIWQLPCVVQSYRNPAEEAASFVALNQSRRPLSTLDVFKAALAAGDDEALAVLVRLHVLGDFYSLAYVALWSRALAEFPALHVFGFTARDPETEIGSALFDLATTQWERFAVRFSGMAGPLWASRIGEDDAEAIACPAQSGATDCCASCMLCVYSQRSILFARH